MSYKIVDEIIEQGGFRPNDKLVLLSLASHADDKKRQAWPSVDTMEFQTGLSRRSVQRSLRNLERLGILRDRTVYFDPDPKHPRKRAAKYGGDGNTTRYEIAEDHDIQVAVFDDLKKRDKQRHTDALHCVRQTHSAASH